MKSNTVVSLADAGEITSPSGYGGWKSMIESPPAQKKGEPEESGREVSSKREHGGRRCVSCKRSNESSASKLEGAWP